MNRILSLLLLCLALLTAGPLGADEAKQPVNVKETLRKAVASLKLLNREQREAALAEVYGLLFMPDGRSAYSSKTSYQTLVVKERTGSVRGRVPFRVVAQGAQFVGSEGKLYDFYAALPERGGTARKKEAWKQAKLYIHLAGKEAVKERFAEELALMEVQRAIGFLRRMSPALRQSLFAELLDLLYTDNGSLAFTGETREERIAGENVPYNRVARSAMYLDAQGNPRSYYGVKDEARAEGNAWTSWWSGVKLAIHHHGMERIFAPFREEIKAMQKHYADMHR